MDGEEKEEEEEVGERAAWRLKKEAAGLAMDMGHAGLFARHFKVTSRVLIGPRPCDHERLTHPVEPIRKRQRASLGGFEIGRTLEEAKLRIIHGTERKFQVAFTGMTRCYLMVLLQDNVCVLCYVSWSDTRKAIDRDYRSQRIIAQAWTSLGDGRNDSCLVGQGRTVRNSGYRRDHCYTRDLGYCYCRCYLNLTL